MLSLRKIFQKLTLRKNANFLVATPDAFSPSSILKRVQKRKPHDLYIARALTAYVRNKWVDDWRAAKESGDTAAEELAISKLTEYPINKFNTSWDARAALKHDKAWPIPYERTVDPETKNRFTGIPRYDEDAPLGIVKHKKSTPPYEKSDVDKIQLDIRLQALRFERRQADLMVQHMIQSSLAEKGIKSDTPIPYDDNNKFKQYLHSIDQEVAPSLSLSQSELDSFIKSMSTYIMTSPAIFEGPNKYEQPQISPEGDVDMNALHSSFSSYIDKLSPIFLQKYLDNSIIKPEYEASNPESLDEPFYPEAGGREEARVDFIEDITAQQKVETGEGAQLAELDILDNLAKLERVAGKSIDEYVNTDTFHVHSILQMLKSKWQQLATQLSKQNPEESEYYTKKVRDSVDLSKISTFNDLKAIIGPGDIDLLDKEPSDIIKSIDANKEQNLSNVLWGSFMAPSGSPSIAYPTFTKTLQTVLKEKPDNLSFNAYFTNKLDAFDEASPIENSPQEEKEISPTPSIVEKNIPQSEPISQQEQTSPVLHNPQLVQWDPGETGIYSEYPTPEDPIEDPAAIDRYKQLLSEGVTLSLRKKKLSLV